MSVRGRADWLEQGRFHWLLTVVAAIAKGRSTVVLAQAQQTDSDAAPSAS